MKKITGSIIKRILSSIIILFLVISFVFILIRLSPGDPSQKFLGSSKSPELTTLLRKTYNLDKPVLTQYVSFVMSFLQGDLGYSYNYREPVLKVISYYAPFTIIFSLMAFVLRFFSGFTLAYFSYRKAGSLFDRIIKRINLIFYASPAFIVGIIFILILSVTFHLFPSSGLQSFDHGDYNFIGKLGDYFSHLFLPLLTMTVCGMPLYYLYIRENLANENQKDYVTFLRSNGTGERKIFYKHILPNTLNPLLGVAGIELGLLLGGTLLAEVVFGLPGMGRLTVGAIFERDYPLVIGCSLVVSFLIIFSNLLADIIKAFLDKRLLTGSLN